MIFKERIGPKQDNETSVYTVAVGEFRPFAIGKLKKAQDAALAYIKQLPGFIGVHPVTGKGTLLLFDTKEHATDARLGLMANGCPVGKNITEVFVDKAFVKEDKSNANAE